MLWWAARVPPEAGLGAVLLPALSRHAGSEPRQPFTTASRPGALPAAQGGLCGSPKTLQALYT